MKFTLLKFAAAAAMFVTSRLAHAGLVQADYLTKGDNLAVYDTKTQLTWLDLSVTDTWLFANWQEFVAKEQGWRLPTVNEVDTLFKTAFPNFVDLYNRGSMTSRSVDTDAINAIKDFRSLFGSTSTKDVPSNETAYMSFGAYLNAANKINFIGIQYNGHYNFYTTFSTLNKTEASDSYSIGGLLLVKNAPTQTSSNAVSTPATLGLFGLGLLGLALRSRQKN